MEPHALHGTDRNVCKAMSMTMDGPLLALGAYQQRVLQSRFVRSYTSRMLQPCAFQALHAHPSEAATARRAKRPCQTACMHRRPVQNQ